MSTGTLHNAPRTPPPPRARKYLLVSEWRDVLEAARAEPGARAEALMLTLYAGGLRASEPGLLRVGYFRFKERQLFVWRGKDSRSGWVDLPKPAVDALVRWLRELYGSTASVDAWIFPGKRHHGQLEGLRNRSVNMIYKRLARAAGLPPNLAHVHVLKHTRVQHLLEAAHEKGLHPSTMLHTIAQIVGHRAAATTIEHYAAQTGPERRLASKVTEELTR